MWAALTPCFSFLGKPAGAAEPAAGKARPAGNSASARGGRPEADLNLERLKARALANAGQGKSREAQADMDAVVKASPSWQNYLSRANVLLKCAAADSDPSPRALLAGKDCQVALSIQKNPLAYYLLTKSYLLAGPSHLKEALKSSQALVDASAAASDSYELRAFVAFMAGDLTAAKTALVQYTADEVRLSHPESHMIIVGPISQMSPRELALIARDAAGITGPRSQARKMLTKALVDFFSKKFASVTGLSKNFRIAFAKNSLAAEDDFGLTLACCAQLLTVQNEAALVDVTELLKTGPVEYSTLMLMDTVYYALNRREEGLKLMSRYESKNKRAYVLARAHVLDDMAQPQAALDVLKGFAKTAPDDDEVLLQIARIEAQLNKINDALDHLRQYIAKNPKAGAPYFMRAQIYAQKSQWEAASVDLTKAIDAGYSLIKAVRARAGCYAALGQKGQARDDMERANTFNQWVR